LAPEMGAAQLRIVTLFDRCVERVHVDMDDFARAARLRRGFFRAPFRPQVSPLPIVRRRGCGSRVTAYPGRGNRYASS
jgi:hypothetical protein